MVANFNPYLRSQPKIRCHNCGEEGHKSTYCQNPQILPEELQKILDQDLEYQTQNVTVLCFKCR